MALEAEGSNTNEPNRTKAEQAALELGVLARKHDLGITRIAFAFDGETGSLYVKGITFHPLPYALRDRT